MSILRRCYEFALSILAFTPLEVGYSLFVAFFFGFCFCCINHSESLGCSMLVPLPPLFLALSIDRWRYTPPSTICTCGYGLSALLSPFFASSRSRRLPRTAPTPPHSFPLIFLHIYRIHAPSALIFVFSYNFDFFSRAPLCPSRHFRSLQIPHSLLSVLSLHRSLVHKSSCSLSISIGVYVKVVLVASI